VAVEPLDNSAVKIIEIMGVSGDSFEDALRQAVDKAAVSINGITSVEVVRQTASVRDGVVARFEVTVKLSFTVR
jgi:dodecin